MLPANRRPTRLTDRRPTGIGRIARAALLVVAAVIVLKIVLLVLAVTISLILTIGMAVVLGIIGMAVYRAMRRRR